MDSRTDLVFFSKDYAQRVVIKWYNHKCSTLTSINNDISAWKIINLSWISIISSIYPVCTPHCNSKIKNKLRLTFRNMVHIFFLLKNNVRHMNRSRVSIPIVYWISNSGWNINSRKITIGQNVSRDKQSRSRKYFEVEIFYLNEDQITKC